MNKLKLCTSTFLILCFAINCFAQEKPQLFIDIERVFREQEPRWKVEQIIYQREYDPNSQDITFRSSKGQAAVSIKIWDRLIDAQDVFKATAIAFDNTSRLPKKSLPNLGDENYMWVNRNSNAWPHIKFRKGKVLVAVFAPSVVIGKRFAQRVADQIPALLTNHSK